MPELIRDGRVQPNTYALVTELTLPNPQTRGDLLVPFALWQAHQALFDAHRFNQAGKVGVLLAPDADVAQLAALFVHFDMIAVDFPKFADGRGFSLAYLLRQRLGFAGELRAHGPLLRDQLYYLQRVGFNAFTLREGQDLHAALASLSDFSLNYQGSVDQPLPLFARDSQAHEAKHA
jgi:uncharacterized protein (DUF934 family)